ncbi:class I SAM-dependent methyltransferase [Streptosporangium sp. NPDC000396]|uniref:class I SAM-dependent methyltransferase n=1 Tax=Streptosporangium sp. NPDC000396 TaxID=3366185 RepID=UPI0036C86C6E
MSAFQELGEPSSTGERLGRGMEQFHHPRPVCTGREGDSRSTPQRELLLAGLTGRVLEIGAGDGVKLTCYPAAVEEVVLVEPDAFLRAAARSAAERTSIPAQIMDGDATRLPVPDRSCDAVVCSLILCSAPRLETTFSEVKRVLRPGGELRFYEHQRSGNPLAALAETLVTPIWSRVSGGCRPSRDVLSAIRRAGFRIERLERFPFHHVDHVLGAARPE